MENHGIELESHFFQLKVDNIFRIYKSLGLPLSTVKKDQIALETLEANIKIKKGEIASLFVFYRPFAGQEYAKYQNAYDALPAGISMKFCDAWRLVPWGYYHFAGRVGLMLFLDAYEKDIKGERLIIVNEYCRKICQLLSIRQLCMAGILPSRTEQAIERFNLENGKNYSRKNAYEKEITVDSVISAIKQRDTDLVWNVVIIGNKGYIGQRCFLRASEYLQPQAQVFPIDTHNTHDFKIIVNNAKDRNFLLVNIANRTAFKPYLQMLDGSAGLCAGLNEAYPEPGDSTLSLARQKGVEIHHIVGFGERNGLVKTKLVPPFLPPYSLERFYDGEIEYTGIPCCAGMMIPTEERPPIITKIIT